MIDPTEDDLSYFADWYLNSGDIKRLYTPFKNPLLFIEGVSGVVLYRKDNFQVELFICQPNTIIPEHTHPDVDSYEIEGMPSYAYETIRVKPNDLHGGTASKNGGSFISIQKWLNGVEPTHVSSNWDGNSMGTKHSEQAKLNG